ncbi:leucine-rich repeat-containing protein 23 [Cololabis saira]|uniref:leucine-rich repeat-containing protein 23 n=1 Tax=Cololabis saira TaxID=129043 RepID=UPI002AD4CD35|nr:leucine-rich repeat-containing protein 23 [Cololabis saira]
MSDTDEDAISSDWGAEEETPLQEDDKIQLYPLTKETISEGLSLLNRVGNGLGHAFVKLDLKEKSLNDIAAISSYIHIRFLDLSKNHLTDLAPLASLSHLLWLKVDNNAVACFKGQPFGELTYLQWLSLAKNKLVDIDGLVCPALQSLNLTGNGIRQMNGFQTGCFANLVTLELRGNLLETTAGINLPTLQRLYLAQNVIDRLEGLEKLECLTILHLRDNKLETFDGLSPSMKCLQYLNVRGNAITNEEVLQSLGHVSKSLRTLVLSNNPMERTLDYRPYVLLLLPQLERIDKDLVSMEDRTEAWELADEEIPEP